MEQEISKKQALFTRMKTYNMEKLAHFIPAFNMTLENNGKKGLFVNYLDRLKKDLNVGVIIIDDKGKKVHKYWSINDDITCVKIEHKQ